MTEKKKAIIRTVAILIAGIMILSVIVANLVQF